MPKFRKDYEIIHTIGGVIVHAYDEQVGRYVNYALATNEDAIGYIKRDAREEGMRIDKIQRVGGFDEIENIFVSWGIRRR